MTSNPIDPSGDAIAWADYDNDGDMDVFVVEGGFSGGGTSRLYRNDGNGVFTPITSGQLAQRSTLGTGAAWGDYDNDGFPDLFLARGDSGQVLAFVPVSQQRRRHFHSSGAKPLHRRHWLCAELLVGGLRQRRLAGPVRQSRMAVARTGSITTTAMARSRACCPAPLPPTAATPRATVGAITTGTGSSICSLANGATDNDYLYHNDGNSNAWITIKCVGTRSNRSAIGAKVRVKATIGGKTFWQLREINTGDGWAGVRSKPTSASATRRMSKRSASNGPQAPCRSFRMSPTKQYLTMTEPSRLSAASSNGVPQFTLQGGRNLQYDIQTSTNLTAWSLLSTLTITNLNGTAMITDTNAPSSGNRFYRALLR